jgi:hypothetical protein
LPRKKSACACALPGCVAPSASDAKIAATTAMRTITVNSALSCRAYCTSCGGRQIALVSRRSAFIADRERPERGVYSQPHATAARPRTHVAPAPRWKARRPRGCRERPEQLARAVGFEPTFPDLETGALDQAKLRPCVMEFVRIGPWGRSRTVDLLSHNQAFWPLNYRRVAMREARLRRSFGGLAFCFACRPGCSQLRCIS